MSALSPLLARSKDSNTKTSLSTFGCSQSTCQNQHHCCLDPRNGYACPYLAWIKEEVTRDCKTALTSVSVNHHERKEFELVIDTIDYYFGLMMHKMDLAKKSRENNLEEPVSCSCNSSNNSGCACKLVYYKRQVLPFQLDKEIDSVAKESIHLPFSYDVSLLEKSLGKEEESTSFKASTEETPYKPPRTNVKDFLYFALHDNDFFPHFAN